MTLNQIFKFLDKNLDPNAGGKFQISNDTNKENIRAFIFDAKSNSYSYVFNFIKESTDGKDVFTSSIRSGYSGIDYKLGLQLNLELFNSIKETLLASDAIYMKKLEMDINNFIDESIKEEASEESPVQEVSEGIVNDGTE